MKMTFGEMIHAARKREGMKAHEVARQAGVSEFTVYGIESGKVRATSFYIALRLCAVLGISLDEAAAATLYELLPPNLGDIPEPVKRRLLALKGPPSA